MKTKKLYFFVFLLLCVDFLIAQPWLLESQDRYIYRIPDKLDDGWEVSIFSLGLLNSLQVNSPRNIFSNFWG